jgi:predicted nucleotidyltransferase
MIIPVMNFNAAVRPFVRRLEESARKILLFGSSAQGTDASESDIDILILTNDKKTAQEKVSTFNRKSGRQVAPVILDATEFAAMRREDQPLLERLDRGLSFGKRPEPSASEMLEERKILRIKRDSALVAKGIAAARPDHAQRRQRRPP